MAVKLHRCPSIWVKTKGHPVLEGAEGARRPGHRLRARRRGRGRAGRAARPCSKAPARRSYPAIEFENGTWYREQSKEMERTIREGRLMEKAGGGG